MVTVIDYAVRKKDGEKPYITLTLEGGIEMVQSQNTGRHYATVRTCVVSSTFDEATAARMVGKEMPGSIERVACDTYDFTIKETGESIKLAYRWDYQPATGRRVFVAKQKTADSSNLVAELTAEEEQALEQSKTEEVVT
jgi:hypothetical protein